MLSHIVRIVERFERKHGMRPNLLHMNRDQLAHLQAGFDKHVELQQVMKMLQMELIIDNECTHPHVSWVQMTRQNIA
jgi:hypothetical protein